MDPQLFQVLVISVVCILSYAVGVWRGWTAHQQNEGRHGS